MSSAPKVAICYWGLTRSTRFIYKTHFEHLYAPLKAAGYEYNVYIHTWRTKNPRTWNQPDLPQDEAEAQLLHPTRFQMDDQEEWFKTVNFSDYFYENVWAKFGDNREFGEWRPELLQNYLCSLESLRRAYTLIDRACDFVIFVRPDMELLAPFPVERLSPMGPNEILLIDIANHEGYNDRFAVMRGTAVAPYACRIENLRPVRILNRHS